jgi:hypothetical protein
VTAADNRLFVEAVSDGDAIALIYKRVRAVKKVQTKPAKITAEALIVNTSEILLKKAHTRCSLELSKMPEELVRRSRLPSFSVRAALVPIRADSLCDRGVSWMMRHADGSGGTARLRTAEGHPRVH